MRKYFAVTAFLVLVLLPRGPNAQSQLFDLKKARQELEIMKGILETTLNFAISELRSRDAAAKKEDQYFKDAAGFKSEFGRFSKVEGFYLYGQGAVFTLSTSAFRHQIAFPGETFDESVKYLVGAASLPPDAQPPSAPSVAQASPSPGGRSGQKSPAINQEDPHKRLAEAQENFKKRKEQETLRRAKEEQLLGEIKAYLVEALANHGDSLTQVKPNEYITLVFTGDDTQFLFSLKTYKLDSGDGSYQPEIVSVQKSVIMDYKAGKLSLESFKQKVLDYKN